MKRTPRVAPTRLTLTALAGVSVLALTACSGGGGQTVSDDAFSVFINVENTEVPAVLETLAGDTCSTEAAAQPLNVETVPQTNLDQQLQLKAGQGDLPVLFSAGNAPALTQTLAESGNIADFEALLTESGQLDKIEPAAVSTIENLYGSFAVLPFEYNVEGIWYNKTIFDEQGIAEPQTWDELTAASEKLDAAGIQPFSASGEQGWPITRLISSYLFRTLGPDAMQKVADGEAKLTDPEYVEAAQAIADLGASGYFGQGVGSIDMATSENQFLNGSAAMFYMGSWFLSGLNDPEANQIGAENVGFMPFPGVEGGAGDRSQLAANVGLPLTMNAKATGENSKAWLSCIVDNYGSTALAQENRVSGFALSEEVADVPPLTQLVQDQIAETETTVLWFEALFTPEATTTSQRNAASLVTGSITAEDFMAQVQADLG